MKLNIMNPPLHTLLLDDAIQDTQYIYQKQPDQIKIIQEINYTISEIYILLHHNIIYEQYSVQSILQIIFTKIRGGYLCYMELLKQPILGNKNNISKEINMEKIIYNIYELFILYFLLLPSNKNEIYSQSIHFYSYFLRFAFLSTNSKFYQDQLTNVYQ
jgi:hypothetical protein